MALTRPLDAALALAAAGFRVVPVHRGKIHEGKPVCSCKQPECTQQGKHPRTQHGIDDASADPHVIEKWFAKWTSANVAIATGSGSGVDVLDIDGPAGEQSLADLAELHGDLPLTWQATSGKGRHLYFAHDDRVKNRVKLAPGVDVRSDRGYIIAPPSVHVSGAHYQWRVHFDEIDLAPWPDWLLGLLLTQKVAPHMAQHVVSKSSTDTPSAGKNLHGAGRDLHASGQLHLSSYSVKACESAFAALRSAQSGTRNDTLNAQAFILGQLAGAGEPVEPEFIKLMALAQEIGLGDQEIRKTATQAYEKGQLKPKEIRQLQPASVALPAGYKRPRLCVVSYQLERMSLEGEAALIGAELPVYQRFGELARVKQGEAGRLSVSPLPQPQLLKLLTIAADWWKIENKKGKQLEVLCKPPADVPAVLATQGEWRFRELVQVFDAPTLRPDGTVLQDPGYDAATKSIYSPTITFPRVPDAPTPEQAQEALAKLWDPFSQFTVKADADRSSILALLLTIIARPAIDGPTPMCVVRGTDRGAGKTLLVDTVSVIATGREAARMSFQDNPEEDEKRMIALGLESAPLALLDNVAKPLGGDVLAIALTGTRYKGRILKESRMVEVPVPVLIATGVNVEVRDDIGRRVFVVDMDPGVENPHKRTGFKWRLPTEAKAKRAELVVHALTILRAFQVAGKPQAPCSVLGSYESWSEQIRQCVMWLGWPDPVETQERMSETGDMDRDATLTFLETWRAEFGSSGATCAVALDRMRQIDGRINSESELANALLLLDPKCSPTRINRRVMGYALRRICGRVVGGMRLVRTDRNEIGTVWSVLKIPTRPVSSGSSGDLQADRQAPSANGPIDLHKTPDDLTILSDLSTNQPSTTGIYVCPTVIAQVDRHTPLESQVPPPQSGVGSTGVRTYETSVGEQRSLVPDDQGLTIKRTINSRPETGQDAPQTREVLGWTVDPDAGDALEP